MKWIVYQDREKSEDESVSVSGESSSVLNSNRESRCAELNFLLSLLYINYWFTVI